MAGSECIERAAASVAESAMRAEELVTPTITDIAQQLNAEVPGLKERLKSLPSIQRKIADLATTYHLPVSIVAREISDALRYTMTVRPADFWESVAKARSLLEADGYMFSGRVAKNSWVAGSSYKGLNTKIHTPGAYLFELQFHTFESFFLKQKLHRAYDIYRDLDTPVNKRLQLFDQMAAQSNYLKWPTADGQPDAAVEPAFLLVRRGVSS